MGRHDLTPCQHCGRQFFEHRLEVHEDVCKKSQSKRIGESVRAGGKAVSVSVRNGGGSCVDHVQQCNSVDLGTLHDQCMADFVHAYRGNTSTAFP